jgi:glycosyltransferase involved in cell wall biosynthesis
MSIKDLVDENLVLDASTDKTPEIVEDLRENQGLPVKLHRMRLGDMAYTRNLGLSMTKHKWILIWDADFILKEEAFEKHGRKKILPRVLAAYMS